LSTDYRPEAREYEPPAIVRRERIEALLVKVKSDIPCCAP